MQVQENDRPSVELHLSADGLTVTWGPAGGPWGIYPKNATPVQVSIKEWWLHVGTKASPEQADNPDEPSEYDIFSASVGASTEKTIAWNELLSRKTQVVLARVIGYFDSQDEHGNTIVEGVYSDVARLLIPS